MEETIEDLIKKVEDLIKSPMAEGHKRLALSQMKARAFDLKEYHIDQMFKAYNLYLEIGVLMRGEDALRK